jgi:hypothetical protein
MLINRKITLENKNIPSVKIKKNECLDFLNKKKFLKVHKPVKSLAQTS